MAETTSTKVAQPEAPAPKKERKVYQTIFPSQVELLKELETRTKGPRRAFVCDHGGKKFYIAANNEGRAGGVAFQQIGGTVEEVGKKPKASKPVGVDGIMAAINGLPESERAAVMAQLKSLMPTKTK
jgi:hypothetical protein